MHSMLCACSKILNAQIILLDIQEISPITLNLTPSFADSEFYRSFYAEAQEDLHAVLSSISPERNTTSFYNVHYSAYQCLYIYYSNCSIQWTSQGNFKHISVHKYKLHKFTSLIIECINLFKHCIVAY